MTPSPNAPSPDLPSAELRDEVRTAIVSWFRQGHRILPWRSQPEPYRVWLSEIMLQQTRVETVVEYFERFTARFPTVEALAGAELDEVLALWSGLGYYSRARNLHKAAQHVVAEWGGEFRPSADELQSLPGVGRYTAGAIASIAFGQPAPIVDGNVIRVLTRLFDIADEVDASATKNHLWRLAGLLVPPEAPSDFNQGLMELGALVCIPKAPRCASCPLVRQCRARRSGTALERPNKRPKKAPKPVTHLAVVVERKSDAAKLLFQRPVEGLWGGLWDVVHVELSAPGCPTTDRVRNEVTAWTGASPVALDRAGDVSHTLSHRALTVHVFSAIIDVGPDYLPPPRENGEATAWLGSMTEAGEWGLSRLVRKIMESAEQPQLLSDA